MKRIAIFLGVTISCLIILSLISTDKCSKEPYTRGSYPASIQYNTPPVRL